ncbi:MAG: peptidylprolyl isomerase [Planctomycetota bacterium]
MLVLLFFHFFLPAFQEPAPAPRPVEPLPPGVVARVGDHLIRRQEYLEYLYTRFGKRALKDLTDEILIRDEARRYGISLDEEDVEDAVEDRLDAARNAPRQTSLEEELRHSGQSLEMFRVSMEREVRRDMLLKALVRATRVVTDAKVRQAFEEQYGSGGVKVRVRHILFMPNLLRSQKIRAGTPAGQIDMETVKAEARSLAEKALARVRAGEPFEAVAREVSMDRVTRDQGGELARYNGRLYGKAFHDAVYALGPGEISDVVESGAGFHVIQLVERAQTRIEDVRDELVQGILAAEPTWQEKSGLLNGLQSDGRVRLW